MLFFLTVDVSSLNLNTFKSSRVLPRPKYLQCMFKNCFELIVKIFEPRNGMIIKIFS